MLSDVNLNPRKVYQHNVLGNGTGHRQHRHARSLGSESVDYYRLYAHIGAISPLLGSHALNANSMRFPPSSSGILSPRAETLRRAAYRVRQLDEASRPASVRCNLASSRRELSQLQWRQLPVSSRLFSQIDTCSITQERLQHLKQPVTTGRDVFEFAALKKWLMQGNTHPMTRAPIALEDIIAIDKNKIFPQEELEAHRALAVVEALSSFTTVEAI